MAIMRVLPASLCLLVAAIGLSVEAFAPFLSKPHPFLQKDHPDKVGGTSSHLQSSSNSNNDEELTRRGLIQYFGVLAPAFWMWQQRPETTRAATTTSDTTSPYMSSTVQLSDAIKTLDMSMPSYGDIKNPTASVENVDSLSVKVTPGSSGGGSGAVGVSKSTKKAGIPMSSVLPSMGKKSAKAKKEERERKSSGLEYEF